MAEVYISGQIESADGFGDNRVCCRWTIQTGPTAFLVKTTNVDEWDELLGRRNAFFFDVDCRNPNGSPACPNAPEVFKLEVRVPVSGGWRVVEGAVEGQTQTDLPSVYEEAYFAHPIDLHLATKTIQGWPRIQLQVWHHDVYGRQELMGYGSLFIPSAPGEHELTCHIWRPKGSAREEVMQRFIGGGLQSLPIEIVVDFMCARCPYWRMRRNDCESAPWRWDEFGDDKSV
ncbi:unnamed protein product [Nippostrongylus brasiliensis]|uniref:B9 domain-containing protein 2 n=1 Tax=Nippostrongylus brasiliensis TaxID=27835 RepID=A0A0N4Y3X4_NIPBR|nr:unnamed protein product [Nippostrongylus brasiliensis]